MNKYSIILIGLIFSLACAHLSASEASEYCSEMYPADSYEPAVRSEYIQECLRSYAGHDDGFSEEADTEDGEEGSFDGSVNDLMNTIEE